MHSHRLMALVGAVLIGATEAGADSLGDRIADAVRDGSVDLSFRYRYEFVDDELFDEQAHANTFKSRLSFAPAPLGDWRFLVEFDDVRHVFNDAFNDTRNGKLDRPLVPDPEGTDLNQVVVSYIGRPGLNLSFGRQRIDRGRQRFVGGHAWRQNEQSFDSISVEYRPEAPYELFYAYVFSVNRIYGPESGAPARDLDTGIHLFDASYDFGPLLRLTGQAYLMDFDEAGTLSNATFGLRGEGSVELTSDVTLRYVGHLASQEDYGSSRVKYDTDYYLLEAGLEFSRLDLGFTLGYEVLGSGDVAGGGFRTPLASLHRFQGWADRFDAVSTFGLNDGIRDFYVGASAQLVGAEFLVRVHGFEADRRGRDWGTELDAAARWPFLERYELLLKYAGFDADEFGADTGKFWLQLSAEF